MMADYCWSIKRDLNNIENDKQSRKRKSLPYFLCPLGFISAVSLLNDLMKILVGLGVFNRVISKDLGSGYFCKNSISLLADQYFGGLNMN